ncbi:hypothetical protein [Rhizobium sp. CC-YZS058]|uniref:hypothetical protein n=1 Tax=Rhizobium sp. CC-YZS058 TaxID=3042153 RepID=UPI002B06086A|nr:hypothetical protein [Rhizobium sp. CC-YZS058]MEA3535442.1 hypothetical protein [Rhizobium sp. CC-YZS058]
MTQATQAATDVAAAFYRKAYSTLRQSVPSSICPDDFDEAFTSSPTVCQRPPLHDERMPGDA